MDTNECSTALENWQAVPGYEGWYEVSDQGQVRRVRSGPNTAPGRILNARSERKGYLRVDLRRDAVIKRIDLAKIVTEAFLGPKPKGLEINHKDRNRYNNRLTNLEYIPHPQNIEHARATGWKVCRGSEHGCAKLSEETVAQAWAWKDELSKGEIGRRLGVSYSAIWDLFKGRTWKWS